MRSWLNGDSFLGKLPASLKDNIKEVKKLSDNGYYDYKSGEPSLTETSDKIFIASAEELNTLNVAYTLAGQGSPYILFSDANSRKSNDLYWTRSTGGKYGIHSFCIIDLNGRLTTNGGGGGNRNGVMIYFCI
jgi:hypothetical protein